jgi:hypothetical protein
MGGVGAITCEQCDWYPLNGGSNYLCCPGGEEPKFSPNKNVWKCKECNDDPAVAGDNDPDPNAPFECISCGHGDGFHWIDNKCEDCNMYDLGNGLELCCKDGEEPEKSKGNKNPLDIGNWKCKACNDDPTNAGDNTNNNFNNPNADNYNPLECVMTCQAGEVPTVSKSGKKWSCKADANAAVAGPAADAVSTAASTPLLVAVVAALIVLVALVLVRKRVEHHTKPSVDESEAPPLAANAAFNATASTLTASQSSASLVKATDRTKPEESVRRSLAQQARCVCVCVCVCV